MPHRSSRVSHLPEQLTKCSNLWVIRNLAGVKRHWGLLREKRALKTQVVMQRWRAPLRKSQRALWNEIAYQKLQQRLKSESTWIQRLIMCSRGTSVVEPKRFYTNWVKMVNKLLILTLEDSVSWGRARLEVSLAAPRSLMQFLGTKRLPLLS